MHTPFKDMLTAFTRAKAYANKLEAAKAVKAASEAFELMTPQSLSGRERFEAEKLAGEVVRGISGLREIKAVLPGGLAYRKGQEFILAEAFLRLHESFTQAERKAELDKIRQRKNDIDRGMLAAQRHLDEKNALEARKILKRLVDTYPDEPGIWFDAGNRLHKAGQLAESVELFEQALRREPRDPRPYAPLLLALEALNEFERAEELVKDALRLFGPNDRTYLNMARLYIKLKRFDEAYDAAKAARDVNPFSREAVRIIRTIEVKVYKVAPSV